jgi:D-alanine-D-alanine ligase
MEEIKKIIVICGGSSSEREISLQSGKGVYDALKKLGYETTIVDFKTISDFNIFKTHDLIFIALHGFEGEGGNLQEKFDDLSIPYTGSGPEACRNTWDKNTCKTILKSHNVMTPSWKYYETLKPFLNEPFKDFQNKNYFLKPSQEGSSVDIFKIKDDKDFMVALNNASNVDRPFLIENCIDGKEFTVTIINNKCMPVIEIVTENEFYDYDAKYISNNTGLIEANLTSEELLAINMVASNAYKALNCRGWARIDILQDITGQFHVLEINTVPGMTSHSCVPKSGSFLGLEYEEVVQNIINAKL